MAVLSCFPPCGARPVQSLASMPCFICTGPAEPEPDPEE